MPSPALLLLQLLLPAVTALVAMVAAVEAWQSPWPIWRQDYGSGKDFETTTGQISDVNGDGLPDFVVSYAPIDANGNYNLNVYLSNGEGWSLSTESTDADKISALTKSPRKVPDVLTTVEAAAFLRLKSAAQVHEYVTQGLLAARRVEDDWRITKKELLRFMDAAKTQKRITNTVIPSLLGKIGSSHLLARFEDYGITDAVLQDLTESDLREMGLSITDRKQIMRGIAQHVKARLWSDDSGNDLDNKPAAGGCSYDNCRDCTSPQPDSTGGFHEPCLWCNGQCVDMHADCDGQCHGQQCADFMQHPKTCN